MSRLLKRILIFIGLPVLLGIIFIIVGIVSSNRLVVDNQIIEYQELSGLKIAHFSDSHLINEASYEMLEEVVKEINIISPDLVFFTGDLYETDHPSIDDTSETIRILSLIECDNIFAVFGNHDLHSINKKETIEATYLDLGIELLVNTNYIYSYNGTDINIIGLDDLMNGDSNYHPILETSDDYEYNLVLSHEPDTFDPIKSYDIISAFAGHSHGGQVRLPFVGGIYNIVGAKKYTKHHHYTNGTHLFVNFGLGATIIQLRFFNPSVLDIYAFE